MKKTTDTISNKIKNGQFFTKSNPFKLQPFIDWISKYNYTDCLEPFAGNKDIQKHILDAGINLGNWHFFDIDPKSEDIVKQDTINNFPQGFKLTITNPPYLAKNSATRMGLKLNMHHDDLYKDALIKMTDNCEKVAAIIPDSFINSGLITNKIEKYIILNFNMFDDTTCPVALVLFDSNKTSNIFDVYMGNNFIGTNKDLEFDFKELKKDLVVKFNVEYSNYFISAVDSSVQNIFVSKDLKNTIKSTDRAKCNFYCNKEFDLIKLNELIKQYRSHTKSIWLTSFKGLLKNNEDGYRKRMSFDIIVKLINEITY